MSNKNILESFGHAFDGFSHVLWTQRHVRVQLFMVMLVFLLAYIMRLDTLRTLFVFSAVAFVLVSELFNTAIEVVVNMVTESYHPLAKIAKDVAAGAVLLASIYAMLVGVAIFLDPASIAQLIGGTHSRFGDSLGNQNLVTIVLVGVALLFIVVPLAKARVGHGSILRGGAVSGHSAVAFLLCAAIVVASGFAPLVSILSLVLAVLVAQSRVEGKIHTLAEVLWGAAVALILMGLLLLSSHLA